MKDVLVLFGERGLFSCRSVGKRQYGGKRMRCPPKEENHENEKSPLMCGGARGKERSVFREEKNGYYILKFPMVMTFLKDECIG